MGVGLFKGDSQTLLRPTPVAMVTKICKFQHKNGYNSGCIRRNPDTSAPGKAPRCLRHLVSAENFTDSVRQAHYK